MKGRRGTRRLLTCETGNPVYDAYFPGEDWKRTGGILETNNLMEQTDCSWADLGQGVAKSEKGKS